LNAKTAYVTICNTNYLSRAKILIDSIAKFHPNWDGYILLVDEPVIDKNINDWGNKYFNSVTFITTKELPISSNVLEFMKNLYDILEFSTSLKPYALKLLLAKGYENVFYFDPDIELFSRLDELEPILFDYDVVLTPHTSNPLPFDKQSPTEENIRQSGVYNLGFIGCNSNVVPFLNWWADRLIWGSSVDVENGLFTDQKWMDFAPAFTNCLILKDPGYNVAYWNLHERNLTEEQGSILVNGEPLRFFHYSGFDPHKPWSMSKHTKHLPRFRLFENKCVEYMSTCYSKHVLENDKKLNTLVKKINPKTITENTDPNVVKLPTLIRKALRNEFKNEIIKGLNFENITFFEWLAESVLTSSNSLPRLLNLIWVQRPDVQSAFPDPGGHDSKSFHKWWMNAGFIEFQMDKEVFEKLIKIQNSSLVKKNKSNHLMNFKYKVGIIGYLDKNFGIGIARNALALSLSENKFDLKGINVNKSSGQIYLRNSVPFKNFFTENDLIITAINADETYRLGDLWTSSQETGIRKRIPQIAYWWWELEQIPEYFLDASKNFDEVWAPTSFIYNNLKSVLGDKVIQTPLLVRLDSETEFLTKEDFDLPTNVPIFLIKFDFFSSISRKNPHTAIKAYIEAFKSQSEAFLLIKTTNGDMCSDLLDEFAWEVRNRTDIRIMDKMLSRGANNDLLRCSNAFLSLHRSEGLGLNIIEAMQNKVAVVTTNYGGNTDFCTTENSFLISYKLTEVEDKSFIYPKMGNWAEPDLDETVKAIKTIAKGGTEIEKKLEHGYETFNQLNVSTAFPDFVEQRIRELNNRNIKLNEYSLEKDNWIERMLFGVKRIFIKSLNILRMK
jgi:glycosyltransferase involved in cell wall biosynthesis